MTLYVFQHNLVDVIHSNFQKSKSENPRWFMVDLTFTSRTKNFIPLAILRFLSSTVLEDVPQELKYIGAHGLKAIKGIVFPKSQASLVQPHLTGLDLVTRGRLSVQRVDQEAWDVIVSMAEKGGWEGIDLKQRGSLAKVKGRRVPEMAESSAHASRNSTKNDDGPEGGTSEDEDQETERDGAILDGKPLPQRRKVALGTNRKRKVEDVGGITGPGRRKSTRTVK